MGTGRKNGRGAAGTRRVVMLTFPQAQVLDVMGPLEVFDYAGRYAGSPGRPAYSVEIVAARQGPVRMSSGLEIVAARSLSGVRGPIDTLMVCGGIGAAEAAADPKLIAWIQKTARRARRVVSICNGTHLLAEAGLLDGKRATTHWMYAEFLAESYPQVTVEPDRIYVQDGNVYSSAGVTAGLDLALALVEEDCGREVALAVARGLVVFMKRPGGQSQFSVQLAGQLADREPLRELQTWIAEHVDADLSVDALAERACMSPRNFARVFSREVGATPARYVERARVEAARRRLEESHDSVEQIAAACGFGSAETMRCAFLRAVRVGPSAYRNRFQAAASG